MLAMLLLALAQPIPPYPRVQDEGTTLTRAEVVNFVGAGVTCERVVAGGVKCTITGGGTPSAHTHAGGDITSAVALATTLDGVWIGPSAPSDPVTYATWLSNGHTGHWGWINTAP